MSQLRIDHVVTSGKFMLDGGVWEVENNIWLVGDDSEVIIIDAAHHAEPIIRAAQGREVRAIVCTHGHNDHITVAPTLSEQLGAPIYVHPGDRTLWDQTYPEVEFIPVEDDKKFSIAGTQLQLIHTPGHSPGSSCLYAPEAAVLFSGDTLFQGGPGATGRSFSSFPTIISSITEQIFTLPMDTKVYTGHGSSTTISLEVPHLEEWIVRGY